MNTRKTTEAEILFRLEMSLTPEGARDIMQIEFCKQDQQRMRVLLEKGNKGTRSVTENDEAAHFERIGHVLSSLNSFARRTLKNV